MKAANGRLPRVYGTSIDRAGYAIAAGGICTGALVAALVALGGQHGMAALGIAWALGSVFAMLGITAVVTPIWLAVHALGWRGPVAAAVTGAALALFVFLGAQTHGFGMLRPLPPSGTALAYRWISAVATSLICAAISAAIAVLMWRIAYRRVA
ncbi:hypothetical protein [Stakelama marina]|uniref:Uncharacterized protein n=1 Tax=Stakelama marina TaxID=2826939 RepID=A0A8T4IFX8_9SPHN|nr:hypothetical protein [Stakelama marina]MBR0553361.1 hypothetical protein [Stakelama marina]